MPEMQKYAPHLYLRGGLGQTRSLVTPMGSGLNPEATPYHSTQTTSNLCSDDLQTVFLQTARAVIQHPFDPCVSLLSIATFGSHEVQMMSCPIVKVSMCLKGYPSMSLTLHTVPTICEPLAQPLAACSYLRTTESIICCPSGLIDGEDSNGNFINGGWKQDDNPNMV